VFIAIAWCSVAFISLAGWSVSAAAGVSRPAATAPDMGVTRQALFMFVLIAVVLAAFLAAVIAMVLARRIRRRQPQPRKAESLVDPWAESARRMEPPAREPQ
jgi:hypothetical protein